MIEYLKKIKKELIKLKDYQPNSWIKIVNPNEKEINFIVEKFNLEKGNIIDGLDVYETPRIEDESGIIYIFLRVPTSIVSQQTTHTLLIILTKENIITISKENLEILNKLESTNIDTRYKTKFLIRVLAYISSSYSTSVRKIMKTVKSDKRNIRQLNNSDILDLVLQEDTLNDYLLSFSPLIGMYNQMLKIKTIKFMEKDRDLLEGLIIDLNQTFYTCKSALKSISNMRDYYSTTLNHNLNRVITILTIFTIFLTIPAVLSSIYGMNIKLPFQQANGIFFILLGIILLIWILLYLIFKKTKLF